jgi:hypothetical protein
VNEITTIGVNALVPRDMDQAIRLAQAMASAKMVPKHLQDDVGTCLMVVEQAMRWGMSPFAVAQCTSNIGGKLMYEGKLVAAAVQTCGGIVGGFDYRFSGAGDERTITVSAVRNGEKQPRTIAIKMGDVKTSNAMWTKQPDQQLVYSGTRNWARRWTPAALLGVYAPEEFNRATGEVFDGTTLDAEAEPEAPPQHAVAAATPRAPRVTETAEKIEKTDDQWRGWLDKLRAACAKVYHREEVVEIGGKKTVADAAATAPDWVKREIAAILAENYARFGSDDGDAASEDDLDEVQIAGEEKLASGD